MLLDHECAPGSLEFIQAVRVALKGPSIDYTVRGVATKLSELVLRLRDTSLSHAAARRLAIQMCEKLILELKGTK